MDSLEVVAGRADPRRVRRAVTAAVGSAQAAAVER
jgi:hypothetical protein